MLDAANRALNFAKGKKKSDLDSNGMFFWAEVKLIQIVGEAATQISPATKKRFSQIPWNQLIGMRNRLAHAYFDINLDILWTTIREHLPLLSKQVAEILDSSKIQE
jgi:uncharacterized protein with HEPN domain